MANAGSFSENKGGYHLAANKKKSYIKAHGGHTGQILPGYDRTLRGAV